MGDNWLLYIQTTALDESAPDPRASDPAYLGQFAQLVGERVQALIDDPSSITPIPFGQATFPPGVGETPTAAP
jgi:hypothetical protein